MAELIMYGVIAGFCSLIGGLLVIWRHESAKKLIIPLISFASGAFLGVSFLDLLPEAVEATDEPQTVFVATLIGFFSFFVIERLMMHHFHRDEEHNDLHSEHAASLPVLIVLGDSIHNFLDGIAIALAYVANPALGFVTTLAIAAHEIPQEIGDFVILLDRGWSKKKIIIVNVLSSLLAIVGVIVGFTTAGFFSNSLPYLLGGMAGIFIYISASNLIPEIQDRARHTQTFRILGAFLCGILSIGSLIFLMHGA